MGNGSEPAPAGLRPVGRRPCEENLHLHPRSPSLAVPGAPQGNHVLQSWWRPSHHHGQGRPRQPRSSGHLPLELGHRTQDTL